MNKKETNSSVSHRNQIIIIIIWIALIIFSFQARSLLTSTVDESEQFTDTSTESGAGSQLILERFNITTDDVTHIIIFQLPKEQNLGKITDNDWRNYTLFLSGYLNTSLYDRGYNRTDTYLSEPVILLSGMPDAQNFASSLISEDMSIGLMYIQTEEKELDDLAEDVSIIRGMLHNVSGFYTYVENLLPTGAINFVMPNQAEAEQINTYLTGSPANFVDIIETAQETFESSEIIAVFVVIIILAIVFRSPMGLAIPVIALIASLFPTYLGTFIMSELGLFGINDFLPALIAMIGIAVAVDYSLFSLVRFREEFRKRKAKHELEG
ncbi:MAG: MMPL family transporter, partial [Candidatus Hodarchaeales archaeon]